MEANHMCRCIVCLFSLFALMSCQKEDVVTHSQSQNGEFLATELGDYMFDITTRSLNSENSLKSNSELSCVEISEEPWNDRRASKTRSAASDESIIWVDVPFLSMYVTDADNSDALLVGNVPLDPSSLTVYDKYDIDKNGTPSAITSSAFFWNDWIHKSQLQDKTVNFYGYYPRPCDVTDWEYRRNSIVELEYATNTAEKWNELRYTFYLDQTDDNLSYFDLMYSMPEEANAGGSHRHGNKNKTQSDNIQMPFRHAFCLLDIEIDRGTYEGECQITSLSVEGTQVFTQGTLDIVKGEINPSVPNVLNRTIKPLDITKEEPFRTKMIVQPTDAPTGNDTDEGRFVLSCTIDGAKYTCPFPNIELQGGKRYKLKLSVTPSGLSVFRVWNGASVTIDGMQFSSCEKKLTTKSEYFTVDHQDGFRILRVLKNGQIMTPDENGHYILDKTEGANSYYNVVACPVENWYTDLNDLRILFDAKWNSKYGSMNTQTKDILYWSDLTGNGNDGTLQSFNNVEEESGWAKDGLYFDGMDDIVRYPGNINPTDFTVEMYLYVYPNQVSGKVYGRLLAEDERTGYPALCLKTAKSIEDGKGNLSVCGNRMVDHGLPSTTNVLGKLVQIDYVYGEGVINLYMNGEWKAKTHGGNSTSIPEASLGNRIADNTRALKAIYHSFLLYNKKLTTDEMKENLKVNISRFGEPTE